VFKFNGISNEQLEIFQTLFDAGFGERTTFGAGYMIERWGK
jgi:CRISPR/Cas system endoribonuclease Cas6 (RAMP superfamily)